MEKTKMVYSNNGKRFAAFFLDSAIVAIFSMVLFAAVGAPIFHYYDTAAQISTVAENVSTQVASTHLLASTDELVPTSSGETTYGTAWIENMASEGYQASSDGIRYYFLNYKTGGTLDEYASCFLSDDYDYKYLYVADTARGVKYTDDYQERINAYFAGSGDSDDSAAFSTALSSFKESYEAIWTEYGKSDAFLPLYKSYLELNQEISFEAGDAALVSYTLSALIFYIAVPFLFKNGRTVAKRSLHLEVHSAKGKLIPWQIVSRGLIETLEFSGLAVFAPFLFIQLPSITLPIAMIGSYLVSMPEIILASLLVTIFSGILAFFSKEKTSLHDLATLTTVEDSIAIYNAKREEEKKKERNGNDGA